MTGADFRNWRVRHDLTQEQAAAIVGVVVHTVRAWEQAVRQPPKHVALLIARLKPGDFPENPGSVGNRPVGIATKNRRKNGRI